MSEHKARNPPAIVIAFDMCSLETIPEGEMLSP
jgi:hypothetical protein